MVPRHQEGTEVRRTGVPPGRLEGETMTPWGKTPQEHWRAARRLLKGMDSSLQIMAVDDCHVSAELHEILSDLVPIILGLVETATHLEDASGLLPFRSR